MLPAVITISPVQSAFEIRQRVMAALNDSASVIIDLSRIETLWPALLELLSSAALKARAESRRLMLKCGQADRYNRLYRMGWADVLDLRF
jgi:hypothetical protein